MSHKNLSESLFSHLQDKHELSEEKQIKLNELLSSEEGRAAWVNELNFQADLIDCLNTEKELSNSLNQNEETIPAFDSFSQNQLHSKNVHMSNSLRISGWVVLAAVIMITFFLSYYINGIPKPNKHTVLGKVFSIEGEVHLSRGPLNIQLLPDMMFKEGDKFLTSKNGVVVFKYDDGSVISVGPNSRFTFATQKQIKREGWKVGLDRGVLDAYITPQNEKMRFKMPALGIEVLGTEFSLISTLDEQKLELFEGKLKVKQISDNSTEFFLVNGQAINYDTKLNSVSQFSLSPPKWVSAKIIDIDKNSMCLIVENDQHKEPIKLNYQNYINVIEDQLQKFKIGHTYLFKLQGKVIPRILESKLVPENQK